MSDFNALLSAREQRDADNPASLTESPFDMALRRREVESQQNLNISASLTVTQDVQPQRAAELNYLSTITGLPRGVVETAEGEAKARAQLQEVIKASAGSPVLRYKLANPQFTELAKDDVSVLSSIEQGVGKTVGYLMGADAHGGVFGDLRRGLYNRSSEASAGAFRALSETLAVPFDFLEEFTSIGGNPLRRLAEGFERIQVDQKAKADGGRQIFGVSAGVQSLGQNAKYLPLLMFGPPGGVAALAGMTAESFGTSYGDAREAGLSQFGSMVYGSSQGAIEFATERMPIGALMGDIAKGTGLMRTLTRQLALELPGEQAATVLQDLNQWAAIDVNQGKTLRDYLNERPSAALETAVATVIGSGGQVALLKAADKVLDGYMTRVFEAQSTTEQYRSIQELMGLSVQSKLRERDPEMFREALQEMLVTQGPENAHVYVDGEVLQQLSPAALASFGDLTQQIEESLATGVAVELPLASVLTFTSGTPDGDLLAQHIRSAPGKMSPAEMMAMGNKANEWLMQEMQTAIDTAPDAVAAYAEYESIKADIQQQLDAAARTPAGANAYLAEIVAAGMTAMASRLGKTASEVYAENKVSVVGARPDAVVGPDTELQQDTESPAFRKWFGDSKVVDAEGRPLVVYHGAAKKFKVFRPSKQGTFGPGIYFADSERSASEFLPGVSADETMVEAYVSLQNPWMIDAEFDSQGAFAEGVDSPAIEAVLSLPKGRQIIDAARKSGTLTEFAHFGPELQRHLKELGYDGIIANYGGDSKEIVAFRPEQIKSATGNRGTFDPNDPNILNQRAEGDTRYQARARELLAEAKVPKRASIGFFTGDEKTPKLPTNFDISRYFTRKNRKGMESWPSPSAQKALVDALYAETLYALTDSGSAVGWYDRKVQAALASVAELHPEIATDEQAKFGFTVMLAITSNSTAVNENFEKAEALYREWKTTGRWPTDVPDTKAADAMRKGLQSIARLVEQHGWEAVRDFMVGDRTVDAIKAFTGEDIQGELADSTLYGAVFLGSKIGAFFNNLYGNFTPVTMDRWFMRTINRLRGNMLRLPGSFPEQLAELRAQLGDPALDTYGVPREALLADIAAYEALADDQQADVLAALDVMPNVLAYSKARLADYSKGGFRRRSRDNVLAKTINESLTLDEQTPAGGGDRALLRGVMRRLQDRLREDGIPIEMADLQAVLWYYEKDLFDLLKGKRQQPGLFAGQPTKEAEDYETAAKRLVRLVRGEGAGSAGLGGLESQPAADRVRAAARPVFVDTTGELFAQGVGDATADGNRGGWTAAGGQAPLPGAPNVAGAAGPDPRLVAVAERYALEHGIPLRRQSRYVEVDEQRAERIAAAYDAMVHAPQAPAVAEAYQNLIQQTMAQYRALEAAGYRFYLVDETNDPYGGNPWNAMRDLRANQTMGVFATEAGFGSGATELNVEDNPLLADTGLAWGYGSPDGPKKRVLANDLFRAVHDAFGHGLEGAGFRAQGEENAWQAHVRMFTGSAIGAITSETRGQNSWLNYGPYGLANRNAKVEDTVFADQKTGLMPEWTWTEGLVEDMPDDGTQREQRRMRQAVDLAVLQGTPADTQTLRQDSAPNGKPGQVAIKGVHFSNGVRSTVDGRFYGTGLRGAEKDRVFNSPDTRLRERTYFYVDEGKGVRPESGVGGYAHEAFLPNLYDINSDPLKLIAGGDINATEVNVLNAGFDGYYRRDAFNQQGAAVVIGPASRGLAVAPIPNPTTKAPPVVTAPPVYTYGLLAREAAALDIAAVQAAAPSAQVRGGNFRVLASEFAAAAAAAASMGVTLPTGRVMQGGGPSLERGTFNVKTLEIVLTENADLSTFIHEAGHFFLEMLMKYGAQPSSPADVRADADAVLRWFGVKDIATWQAMTLEEKRPYHERWAESFEQYKFEGKAPTKELQPAFRKFSAFLKQVYGSIQNMLKVAKSRGSDMTLELNDDIRNVMDRIMSADAVLRESEEQLGGAVAQEATDAAMETLEARSLRNMKWLAGARSRYVKQLQAQAKETRKNVREEVVAEVNLMPPVMARKALDALKVVPEHQVLLDQWSAERKAAQAQADADSREAAIAEEEAQSGVRPAGLALGQFLAKHKREINNAAERRMIDWDRANPKPLRPVNTTDQDMATVADSFGYPTVDDMMQAIRDFGRVSDVIEGMTDQRMLEDHGDMVDQRAIENAANEALHNDARTRAMAAEIAAEQAAMNPRADTGRVSATGARVTVNVLVEAAKRYADQLTAKTLVRDLRSRRAAYNAAEKKAATAYTDAKRVGKSQDAVKARQSQLLNSSAARALTDAIAEAQNMVEFVRTTLRDSNEKLVEKGRDPDVVNAMRAVLAEFGVGTRTTKSASSYLKAVANNDPETAANLEAMIEPLMEFAQPIEALSYGELSELHEAMKAMWFMAKQMRQMEVNGDKVDVQDIADELRAELDKIGVPLGAPGDAGSMTEAEKRVSSLRFWRAALTRMEQWSAAYGPAFTKYLFRQVKEAADRYRADRVKYRKRYVQLLENISPALKDGEIAAPELNGFVFGRGKVKGHAELLHAVLHTGNESNKRKLLLGRRWATENEDGALDTSRWDAFVERMQNTGYLRKEHYDFAQRTWDLLEEIKPLAQRAHREVYGRYFDEVTAQAFDTPFGAYRGGYVPAQASMEESADADRALLNEQNEALVNAFPSAPRGFTKSRTDYNTKLSLDLASLGTHIDQVLRFSHMQPVVRGVTRLIKNKTFSQPMGKVDNSAIGGLILPFLNRAARQSAETPVYADGGFMRVVSIARSRAGMALMMGNLINALQQTTGFINAAATVRPALMLQAAAQFAASPKRFNETVRSASIFMKDRMANEIAAINDTMEEVLLDPTLLKSAQAWTNRHAYFLQSAFDNTMSPIVWTAAYNQATAGKQSHEDAVAFADSTVRTTQTSTLPEDISRAESGNPLLRLFTQFANYFNMMANTYLSNLAQLAREGGLSNNKARALYLTFTGLLLPIWVAEGIALAFRGGPADEDEDGWYWDDWIAQVMGLGTARSLLAAVPGLGQIGVAAINRFNDNPLDDRASLSPVVSLLETAGGIPYKTWRLVTDQTVSVRGYINDVATALTVGLGLPFRPLVRPLGYATGVLADEIEPTSAADAVRGLLTGAPSPESRQ